MSRRLAPAPRRGGPAGCLAREDPETSGDALVPRDASYATFPGTRRGRDGSMPAASTETGDLIPLPADGSEAAVALAGAQPVLWRVAGRDLLWTGDPAHWGWHAPLLFPVVGQVHGGRVRIGGESFDMPRHGFARISPFRCLDRTDSS